MLLIAGGKSPAPAPAPARHEIPDGPNHSESLANHKAQQFKTLLVLEVHYK